MGDVPDSIGVCTDVVIRSYRALGIDLRSPQEEELAVVADRIIHLTREAEAES